METQVDGTTSEKTCRESQLQTGIASYEDTCIKLCESKDEVANSSDSSEVTEFRRSKRERKLTELKTNIYKQTKSCLIDKLLYLKTEVNSIDTASISCEIKQLEALVKDFNYVSELLKLPQPIQRESYIREYQAILSDWNDVKASLILNSQIHELTTSGLTKRHRFRMRRNQSLPQYALLHLF